MAKDLLLKKDLYLILDVDETASEKQILKGYRKKALKCHPDKNPDNPKAAEEFHELSLALEILTDPAAKAAYDRSRKAKKEVQARNKELDSKRKKFKDDLEAREKAAEERLQKVSEVDAERKLQIEVERLREEGSRLLEQEKARLRDLLKTASTVQEHTDNQQADNIPRMKLKWKAVKGDPKNGGYSETILSDIFNCYGNISTLLVSSKRNGSAILEFGPSGVSSDVLDETGLSENPFTITWLCGKPGPSVNPAPRISKVTDYNAFDFSNNRTSSVNFTTGSESDPTSQTNFPCGVSQVGQSYTSSTPSDFESLVLRKMRQAEERKKLMEQIAKEDEENG